MLESSNADWAIPLMIIGACLMLMVITWVFTRGRKTTTVAADREVPQAPIAGQTHVTQAQLGIWHRAYGDTVNQWIENHERVLKLVSDSGMAIDLNADLTAGHDRLGPAIDDAITKHPAPRMRAELSALVLASKNTIDSLRRSNWTNAEKEHISYIKNRVTWLDRLRQFTTAESQVMDSRSVGARAIAPGWLDPDDSAPR